MFSRRTSSAAFGDNLQYDVPRPGTLQLDTCVFGRKRQKNPDNSLRAMARKYLDQATQKICLAEDGDSYEALFRNFSASGHTAEARCALPFDGHVDVSLGVGEAGRHCFRVRSQRRPPQHESLRTYHSPSAARSR